MVFVEIAGAEGHLRLPEDGLLDCCGTVADLVVLDEEVAMLVLPVAIVYLLLEALHRRLLLICPLADGYLIARIGHTVVTRLPWTDIVCGDLVKVVLRHTSHLH